MCRQTCQNWCLTWLRRYSTRVICLRYVDEFEAMISNTLIFRQTCARNGASHRWRHFSGMTNPNTYALFKSTRTRMTTSLVGDNKLGISCYCRNSPNTQKPKRVIVFFSKNYKTKKLPLCGCHNSPNTHKHNSALTMCLKTKQLTLHAYHVF